MEAPPHRHDLADTVARVTLRASPIRLGIATILVASASVLLPGCGSNATTTWGVQRRLPARAATGLAVTDEGTLVVGQRDGAISTVDLDTGIVDQVTALDDLAAGLDQGGLLGLAVAPDAGLLVSSVADDGRLRIEHVDPATGDRTIRWTGPKAEERANGGRIAVMDDNTVLIGVGDLLDPSKTKDPAEPNGKVLAVGADGTTTPWATGFNNPFALASTLDDGVLWVADNAPDSRSERLLRVTDGAVEQVASWTDTRVPSGIAVSRPGRIVICEYATRHLTEIDIENPDFGKGKVIARDCRYGVVALPDGRLAYAAEDEVVILAPPD